MRIFVIGGFLGSGKTSLLTQLAACVTGTSHPDSGPDGIKVVILENEIGKTQIDGNFLKSTGLQIRNLAAGCACCTLIGEVNDTIYRIHREIDPDWVFLEASGVAIPETICASIRRMGFPVRSCVLADASRWKKIAGPLERFLDAQIGQCDVLLLNKADLIPEEELLEIERDIRSRTACVTVLRTCLRTALPTEVRQKILF